MDIIQNIVVPLVGIALIIFLVILAGRRSNPTPFQYSVYKVTLALAAGAVAAAIPGFLTLNLGTEAGWLLRAGGALAVFALYTRKAEVLPGEGKSGAKDIQADQVGVKSGPEEVAGAAESLRPEPPPSPPPAAGIVTQMAGTGDKQIDAVLSQLRQLPSMGPAKVPALPEVLPLLGQLFQRAPLATKSITGVRKDGRGCCMPSPPPR